MLRLLLRRFLGLVLTLLAVSALVFAVVNLLPGDPAAIQLGTSASPETLAALRSAMGLDLPLPVRYGRWLLRLAAGDFGSSSTYGVPVAGLIAERLAVTLPLAAAAMALSVAIALPLGARAAAKTGGLVDHAATLFSQLGIAIPGFWVGLMLIASLSVGLGLLPSGGFPGWSTGPGPAVAALILPTLSLALPQAAVLTRVTRAAVVDVLGEDFVRTARAKGLTWAEALWRHALPNALVPVLTILGLQFTFLVAGTVLIENVFALPGLGRLAFQALSQRDIAVIEAVVLMLSALVVVVNFLIDLAHLAVDPRSGGRS
jgi:peptide/nickel transport system permease protein